MAIIAAIHIYGYEVARQQFPVSSEVTCSSPSSEIASSSSLLMDIPSSSSLEGLSAVEGDTSFWMAVCVKSLLAFLVKFGSLCLSSISFRALGL